MTRVNKFSLLFINVHITRTIVNKGLLLYQSMVRGLLIASKEPTRHPHPGTLHSSPIELGWCSLSRIAGPTCLAANLSSFYDSFSADQPSHQERCTIFLNESATRPEGPIRSAQCSQDILQMKLSDHTRCSFTKGRSRHMRDVSARRS